MNIELSDTRYEVELLEIELVKARAVLLEVLRYFGDIIEPDTWQAYDFVNRREHIHCLLGVTNDIIFDAIPKLNQVVKDLIEYNCASKQEKGASATCSS